MTSIGVQPQERPFRPSRANNPREDAKAAATDETFEVTGVGRAAVNLRVHERPPIDVKMTWEEACSERNLRRGTRLRNAEAKTSRALAVRNRTASASRNEIRQEGKRNPGDANVQVRRW